ncbi:hypothetical protein [Peribacillus sp. FSL M8-0224]|uniref:hypothetical protein n=1 Tax=Peribacillus sp. FSL M8-0224 TaxID=2921568 RepID=UPI0030FA4715|nr:hypothetical protein KY492_20265 [Brevibacterium sp. PAMC21349]
MKTARGIILAEDEVVIREYEASYIDVPKSEGYIITTNRRLIFTGSTSSAMGSSIIVRDTKIDNITGVVGGLTRKKSIIQIIIGVIIALIGLVGIFNDFNIIMLLVLLLGSYIAYRGISAGGVQMYLSIFSSQAAPAISVAVEASRGLFSRISKHDAVMTVAASGPGKHTEQMIREIGALVQDIQIMGELAVSKWIDKPMSIENFRQYSKKEQLTSTIETIKQTATMVKETAVTATDSVVEVSKKTKATKESPKSTKQCECGTTLLAEAEFCTECGKKQQAQENIFG